MAENPATTESTAQTTSPAAAQTTESGQQSTTEPTIPKARFDEVNTRAKAAEAELAKIKADQAAVEEANAKAQGKWQELADKRTTELTELKPQLESVTAERDRYQAVLTEHVKTLREGLSSEITELLDNLSPDKQLEWITRNREKAGVNGGAPRGNGPGPKPSGQQGHETKVQENQRKLQSTGAYNPF